MIYTVQVIADGELMKGEFQAASHQEAAEKAAVKWEGEVIRCNEIHLMFNEVFAYLIKTRFLGGEGSYEAIYHVSWTPRD